MDATPARARPAPIGAITRPLLRLVDAVGAVLLLLDLGVVCASVLFRYGLNAPIEWSDDVARGLMVALSFFGAASALARGDNDGISFFVDRLPAG
jgi:TRAP-type C4-dicarboxylate transport system permease small subunit